MNDDNLFGDEKTVLIDGQKCAVIEDKNPRAYAELLKMAFNDKIKVTLENCMEYYRISDFLNIGNRNLDEGGDDDSEDEFVEMCEKCEENYYYDHDDDHEYWDDPYRWKESNEQSWDDTENETTDSENDDAKDHDAVYTRTVVFRNSKTLACRPVEYDDSEISSLSIEYLSDDIKNFIYDNVDKLDEKQFYKIFENGFEDQLKMVIYKYTCLTKITPNPNNRRLKNKYWKSENFWNFYFDRSKKNWQTKIKFFKRILQIIQLNLGCEYDENGYFKKIIYLTKREEPFRTTYYKAFHHELRKSAFKLNINDCTAYAATGAPQLPRLPRLFEKKNQVS